MISWEVHCKVAGELILAGKPGKLAQMDEPTGNCSCSLMTRHTYESTESCLQVKPPRQSGLGPPLSTCTVVRLLELPRSQDAGTLYLHLLRVKGVGRQSRPADRINKSWPAERAEIRQFQHLFFNSK